MILRIIAAKEIGDSNSGENEEIDPNNNESNSINDGTDSTNHQNAISTIRNADREKSEIRRSKSAPSKAKSRKIVDKEQQQKMYEQHRDEFYDFENKCMKKWNGKLLDSLAKLHGTTKQNIWLMAARYGKEMEYTETSKRNEPISDDDENSGDVDYIPSAEGKAEVLNPNSEWRLYVKGVDEFTVSDGRKNHHSRGLIGMLRMILWQRFHYPCNFNFGTVSGKDGEMFVTAMCKVCRCTAEFHNENKQAALRANTCLAAESFLFH